MGVCLIEVPFVPWAAYFPGLQPLFERGGAAIPAWQNEAERERCRRVWEMLSPRQREALRALVGYPDRAQAAACLGVAVSTLDSHRAGIAARCRDVWGLADGVVVNVRFLRERFGPFLAGRERA